MKFAVLKCYNNDLSKAWYVEFKDEYFERKRVSNGSKFGLIGDGNRFMKVSERKRFFKALKNEIVNYYANLPSLSASAPVLVVPALSNDVSCPTAAEAVAVWIEVKRIKGLAKPSLDDYRGRCFQFLNKMNLQQTACNELTTEQVKAFLAFHKEGGHVNYNHFIATLRNWCNFLVEQKYIKTNIVTGISNRNGVTKSNVAYSVDDAKRVLSVLKTRAPLVWLACLLEYYCFLRPNELEQLEWRDIDLVRGTLTVRADCSKVRQTRTLPVHRDLKIAMLQFRAWQTGCLGKRLESDFIFTHPKTKERVAYKYCSGRFKYLRNELNIPTGCTFYSFKHTGCVELYRATKDIYLISKMCGHTNITTTQKYLRSLGEDVDYLDSSALSSIL